MFLTSFLPKKALSTCSWLFGVLRLLSPATFRPCTYCASTSRFFSYWSASCANVNLSAEKACSPFSLYSSRNFVLARLASALVSNGTESFSRLLPDSSTHWKRPYHFRCALL